MRRTLVAVSIVLALAVGMVGPAAQAGEGYWTPTKCGQDYPTKGMWFGQRTMGVWFRSVYGQYGVLGRFYQAHVALGAECGFGFPITDPQRGEGGSAQFFYIPGTCDLRAIVAWDNGTTTSAVAGHYYC